MRIMGLLSRSILSSNLHINVIIVLFFKTALARYIVIVRKVISMPGTDLTKALNECYESAKSGHELASNERTVLDGILRSAEEKIQETAIDYKASPCEVIGIGETLEEQLAEIQQSVNNLRLSFAEDLEILKNNLEKFSVTLFGRTMAGKSTLMEVLTEGDGSAIGMGAQRTTRDIRSYEWNGLSVTDVPGIGAFEGEEDTRLAFDAARTADLIIFLLTDDAPQAVEADCFRQVKDLGKPVIIIMNVKVSVDAALCIWSVAFCKE